MGAVEPDPVKACDLWLDSLAAGRSAGHGTLMDVIAGGADVLMRTNTSCTIADLKAIVAAVEVELGSAPGH